MPFLLLPLDFDGVPLTYAIRFRGKLLPVLGTLILSSAIAASTPRTSGLMDCRGASTARRNESHTTGFGPARCVERFPYTAMFKAFEGYQAESAERSV